jgi:uncharacterized protein YukE
MSTYDGFLKANKQCEKWKAAYTNLSEALEERERKICYRQGIFDEDNIYIRIKEVEAKVKLLQGYLAKYNFWRGEVERLYYCMDLEWRIRNGATSTNVVAPIRRREGLVSQTNRSGRVS